MFSHLRQKGFSLVEAILASFLLLGAVLMAVSLFDGTLRAEVSNEKRVLAALAAESAMAEIRHSADTDFRNLVSTYHNQTLSLPEFPDFQVRARVQRARLAIPCTPLEAGQYTDADLFPLPEGRFLKHSSYLVQVDVSWDEHGANGVSLVENVVNFTPSTDFSLDITFADGTPVADGTVVNIARRARQGFRVLATSEGQEVRDIQFTWHVEPLTGIGSINRVSRDGRRCRYLNGYRNFNGQVKDSPGACNLVVEATYQGVRAVDKVRIENEV